MKRSTIAAMLFIAAAAPAAWAGEKGVHNVNVNTTSRYAEGSLGTTRNSSDTVQLLGCWVNTSSTGTLSGYCAARNASGVTGNCTTSAPELIAQMRALSGDTYIRFFWDTSGYCTSLFSSNFSTFEPKAQ
jgi:hypothetical protein